MIFHFHGFQVRFRVSRGFRAFAGGLKVSQRFSGTFEDCFRAVLGVLKGISKSLGELQGVSREVPRGPRCSRGFQEY